MNQTSRILEEVKKAVCGKDRVLVWVLTVLLARGHVLLEDIPGVGKTTMALAFSRALGLEMDSRTVKRSICESGSSCVPAAPVGFCVAKTINGCGIGWLTPSTVTCPSSMASSSADCVRDVARLSSSARNRLQSTAPG